MDSLMALNSGRRFKAMKSIATVLMSSLFISPVAMARIPLPGRLGAPAAKKLAAPVKNRQARTDKASCKRKGGDFSPGAESCVFSGRALRCEKRRLETAGFTSLHRHTERVSLGAENSVRLKVKKYLDKSFLAERTHFSTCCELGREIAKRVFQERVFMTERPQFKSMGVTSSSAGPAGRQFRMAPK
jgi:hypothetical protein